MNKILSVILSLITALSGFVYTGFEDIFISYTEKIEDCDISQLSENSGYVKNTMIVIFDEDAFTLLQNILDEADELSERVPYETLVTTQFAESAASK